MMQKLVFAATTNWLKKQPNLANSFRYIFLGVYLKNYGPVNWFQTRNGIWVSRLRESGHFTTAATKLIQIQIKIRQQKFVNYYLTSKEYLV